MTFVLFGLLSSGRSLLKRDPTRNVNIALQALRPCSADLPPCGNFFGSFAPWDFFLFLFPPFRQAGEGGGVSGCTWCCVWWGSLPPARPRSSERGGSASRHLSGVSGLASSSPSPSGGGGVGVARSRQTSFSPRLRVCGLSLILTARSTT